LMWPWIPEAYELELIRVQNFSKNY